MEPPVDHTRERLTKGINLLGMVKMLRGYRYHSSVEGLAQPSLELLNERIIVSNWYPLERLWEMLEFTYERLLGRDPARAVELGRRGGVKIWGSAHRLFIRDATLETLRLTSEHGWSSYFNFGRLDVRAVEDENAVEFVVCDYPDVPEVHGMSIIGWHIAAAQLSGAHKARGELLRAPWLGDPEQVHRICW
jgi:hypothetical protein